MNGKAWLWICGAGFLGLASLSAEPKLSRTIPCGALAGGMTEVTFLGEKLSGVSRLWTSFRSESALAEGVEGNGVEEGKVIYRLTVPEDVPVGIGAVRLGTSEGVSSLHLFLVDDLPSERENGKNNRMESAQELTLPTAIDGVCEELGYDFYRFKAKKGERVSLEVVAERLGSRLDSCLRLLDSRGRELAYCDDDPAVGRDSRIGMVIPSDGDYWLELRDITYEGGEDHWYRLRFGHFPLVSAPYPLGAAAGEEGVFELIGPAVEGLERVRVEVPTNGFWFPVNASYGAGQGSGFARGLVGRFPERMESEPNNELETATLITCPATVNGRFGEKADVDFFKFEGHEGERLVFRGRTRSLGSPCDLFLELRKADGSRLARADVSGADEGTLTNTLPEAGMYYLVLEELNRRGGAELAYRVEVEQVRSAGFELRVEEEHIQAAAGGEFKLKVTAARGGYEGRIELSLEGLGDGDVIVEEGEIPEKKNEGMLRVKLPDRFKPGQINHFRVMGKASVDGMSYEAVASTMPALRKLFRGQAYGAGEFDGWIALGVKR